MASRISKTEWKVVFIVAGIIDAIQFLTDLFLTEFIAIPEIIWEIVDPIIGVFIVIYFEIRGVSIIKHPKRLFSLLCVTGLEEFTGGLAPAWIIDIWYIWSSSNQEESAEAEKKKLSSQSINGEEGIRRPNNQIRSVNTKEGVRPPRIHSPMSKK